jgi:hypothetical protein
MYHFQWQWSYTIYAAVFLLSLFVLAGVLLLRRAFSSRLRLRHTPTSISTRYGYIPWWDVKTRRMFAVGKERARNREYFIKGRE